MGAYTRFFATPEGVHIAYATLGAGPPLVCLPPFLSHLELMWEAPAFQAFNAALATDFTLIRYDRYGCGFSDRDRTDFSLEVDVHVLAALVDHLRLRRFALFGASAGGLVAVRYATMNPRRVSHLLLFGSKYQAARISASRAALHQLLLADLRLGTNALADYLLPDADADALGWFARLNREGATAEMIVGLGEAMAAADVTDALRELRVPTMVMNRRDDLLNPFESARELAALIPGAHLAVMPGNAHIPEFGDIAPIVRAIKDFVAASGRRQPPAEATVAVPGLSAREAEVLGLIASGMTNREIAERLSLSVHTVERHTVNLYAKLGIRGRAEATAYALNCSGMVPRLGAT